MSGEQHNDLCTDVPFNGATGFRDPQGVVTTTAVVSWSIELVAMA
jgi:hypothetical protein